MKHTVIAVAVAGLCSSSIAFAAGAATPPDSDTSSVAKHYYEDVNVSLKNNADVTLKKKIDVSKTLSLYGDVSISGHIGEIDNAAMATVDNKQVRTGNRGTYTGSGMTNDASAGYGMGAGATGNVQANITAGDGNLQKNVVAIATSEAPSGYQTGRLPGFSGPRSNGSADAEVFILQESAENYGSYNDSHNKADVKSDLFEGLQGNGQLNVSAGSWNGQENVVAIAHASNAILAESTSYALQQASDNETMFNGGGNYATLGNNAFKRLSGSGQLNVASGLNNSQNNQLIITSATARN